MQEIIQHPWAISIIVFIKNHPVLWFLLLILFIFITFINWFTKTIPQLDIFRSKILLPIAKKYKHKKLVKTAIKSDIRGHVNLQISKMREYLPKGWAEDMDLEWVEKETEPTSLEDDQRIIVRIRPVNDQDKNFVNASYQYLHSSFFPRTQEVVPKPHYEASVLYVCRKIAERRNDNTKKIFEDDVLEPMIQRHSQIPTHLDDYEYLEKRGFFTGTFLRELHLMATDVRFSGARNTVTQETTEIIKHIKDFIKQYDLHRDGGENMPTTAWYKNNGTSKYALLLVAHPEKTKSGIDAYVNRARSSFQEGAKRVYVFGSNNEKSFAELVISAIETTVDNVKLVEKFRTPYDYRGDKYGIGAIFETESL